MVLIALAASLLLLAGLGYPIFLDRAHSSSDIGNFYLPIRQFYRASLLQGDGFIWYPYEFSGFYLHGEGQAGLYHPLNLLLYRFVPLVTALNVELLRSYAFLLLGTFLFLRRLDLPRDAALFGSLVFAFSGFNLLHYMHLNVVAAAAHLPWLLFAIDVTLRSADRRRVALGTLGIVLLTCSLFLIGHPQVVWMSAFAEGLYALLVLARTPRPAAAARLLAAKALGGAGAAIQVLPVFETLAESSRAAPPESFRIAYSLQPLDLAQLLAPYLFENRVVDVNAVEEGLYSGALAPVVFVWLLLRRRSLGVWRAPALASALLAGLALLLALGESGLLYRVQLELPVIGLFRAPARYILLLQLGVAVAAAIAFADLRRLRAEPLSWRSLGFLALLPLAAGAVAIAVPVFGGSGIAVGAPALVAAGPVLLVVATLLVALAASGARGVLAALIVFAALDQGAYGLSFVWRDRPIDVETYVRSLASPSELRDRDQQRILLGPPTLAMIGVRFAWGYVAMMPRRKLLNERYREMDERALRNALRVASVVSAFGRAVPDPLPRARLVTEARESADPFHDVGEIDVDTTALVPDPIALPPGAPGRALISRERPGEIQLATRADTRQLLVLSESHHEGWRAYVDGEPAEVVPTYGDFMGCVVDAGEHRVRFVFEPSSLRRGRQLSLLALALAGLWFAVDLARSGRRPTAPRRTSGIASRKNAASL